MNVNLGEISAYGVILFIIMMCVADRFLWVRGGLRVAKVKRYDNQGGMIRFALHYHIKCLPMWSEVRYSLIDKKNPTTVISGKTRGLDFSKKGHNAEFLLFKANIVAEGDWELKIKVITMAGRLNPLYSLFPVHTFHTESVRIK
jgi:hypothetical protein